MLEEYEWADVVVVARAVSLEMEPKEGEAGSSDEGEPGEGAPAESGGAAGDKGAGERKAAGAKEETKPGEVEGEEDDEEGRRVTSAKMSVERVYKGWLKVGEEMAFAQGFSCGYTFDKEDIGRAYLFYLKGDKGEDFWAAGTCGRSSPVEGARDDLLYLNNLPRARGRTRVSGTLDCFRAQGPDLAGLRIRLRGNGKTFETRADEHGVYEFYDLPPGKYTFEPEIPYGWKVDNFYLGYSPSFAGDGEGRSPKKIPIVVEEKRHAGLDIVFEIDNAVAGKVFGPSGRPRNGVCLQLIPARGEVPKTYHKGTCTENGGRFRIEEIYPGDYVLVANGEGEISSREPYGTFYYPNAARREDATVFHVGPGDMVEGLQVHITKMAETVTVEGVLLYSDGKPVADERVVFKVENGVEDDPSDSAAGTDANGRFAVTILKGRRGTLHGAMYAYVGEFENCPRLESLIKQTGNNDADLTTPAVEVQADNDLYGVELRFPFPGCKRAKR